MTAGPSHPFNIPLDLERGIDALGLRVNEAQQQQLLGYMDLIQKWNKVYNLTALRNPQEILTHHVLDSLSVISPLLRHFEQKNGAAPAGVSLLDVGSGGGCRAWSSPSVALLFASHASTLFQRRLHSFSRWLPV